MAEDAVTNIPVPSSDAACNVQEPDTTIALGLGLTNECNLACVFCYRDPARTDRLSLDQVKAVMERLPVSSVNLGTGENGMHPDFKAILSYLRTRPIKLTITSNGHSVAVLQDDELRAFHDVEFSLDYPTQREQDAQRGEGNWELIQQQAERCVRLGVPVTIIAVMMKANYLRLAEVARVAKRFDAPLRVNVYQSVRSDLYALSYDEYWEGFRQLFAETDVIAIGEPLVRAMAGLPPQQEGCGFSTVRVTPRATTQPCVYWPGPGEPLSGLLSMGVDILQLRPLRASPHPSRRVPCLRISRSLPRWLWRTPTPSGRAAGARLLLPDHARTTTDPLRTHGRRPRPAQAKELLHYGCGRAVALRLFSIHPRVRSNQLDGYIREPKM